MTIIQLLIWCNLQEVQPLWKICIYLRIKCINTKRGGEQSRFSKKYYAVRKIYITRSEHFRVFLWNLIRESLITTIEIAHSSIFLDVNELVVESAAFAFPLHIQISQELFNALWEIIILKDHNLCQLFLESNFK